MVEHTYKDLEAQKPLSALQGLEVEAREDSALTLREIWPFTAQQITWLGALPAAMPQSAKDGAQIKKTETLLPYMPGKVLRIAAKPKIIQDALSVDLSPGRTLLTLTGRDWRWTLMKGGSLDFETMKRGDCATTILFKIGVTLWVSEEDQAHILVSYAYARALAEKLQDAAHDIGLTIIPA